MLFGWFTKPSTSLLVTSPREEGGVSRLPRSVDLGNPCPERRMSMQPLADNVWLAEWLIGMGDVAVQRVRDVITRHDDEAALMTACHHTQSSRLEIEPGW